MTDIALVACLLMLVAGIAIIAWAYSGGAAGE